MRNSNGTIGNRTHDLLACSTVPQPTAPPCAPVKVQYCNKKWCNYGAQTAHNTTGTVTLDEQRTRKDVKEGVSGLFYSFVLIGHKHLQHSLLSVPTDLRLCSSVFCQQGIFVCSVWFSE